MCAGLASCSANGPSLTFGHASIDAYKSGLAAYYRMSEISGTRADATTTNDLSDGNSVGVATGKTGNGADFEDTSSHYLTRGNTNTLKPTSSFAISAWIKLESVPTTTAYVFRSVLSGNTAVGFYLTASTGIVGLVRQSDAQSKGASLSTYSFSTATWYHIALVGTGSLLRVYVNASLQASAGYSDIVASDSGFYIGAGGTSTGHFDGIIDEFGFWTDAGIGSTAAADAFVTALYNSGTGRFPQ